MTQTDYVRLRPWMWGIIVSLLTLAGSIAYWSGSLAKRVETLEVANTDIQKRANEGREGRASLDIRLTRLEARFEDVATTLSRMDRRLDSIDQKMNNSRASAGPPGSRQ